MYVCNPIYINLARKMEERIDFQNSEMLKNMIQGNSYHLNSN